MKTRLFMFYLKKEKKKNNLALCYKICKTATGYISTSLLLHVEKWGNVISLYFNGISVSQHVDWQH